MSQRRHRYPTRRRSRCPPRRMSSIRSRRRHTMWYSGAHPLPARPLLQSRRCCQRGPSRRTFLGVPAAVAADRLRSLRTRTAHRCRSTARTLRSSTNARSGLAEGPARGRVAGARVRSDERARGQGNAPLRQRLRDHATGGCRSRHLILLPARPVACCRCTTGRCRERLSVARFRPRGRRTAGKSYRHICAALLRSRSAQFVVERGRRIVL